VSKEIVEKLEKTCPDCGSHIVLKTKKGFLTSKKWLTCPDCRKTWKSLDEYNNDVKMKKEAEELEMIEKTGQLPTLVLIGSDLVLRKKEELHLHEEPVRLLEERVRTYSFKTQSVGVSFKLAKGVRVSPRLGGGTIKQKESVIEPVDEGELYLTSKRLIFVGTKKTVNINLNKIFAVECFSDAIKIGREGKQKAEYFTVQNPAKWELFIRKAIEKIEL
jgi:hypothetical protein